MMILVVHDSLINLIAKYNGRPNGDIMRGVNVNGLPYTINPDCSLSYSVKENRPYITVDVYTEIGGRNMLSSFSVPAESLKETKLLSLLDMFYERILHDLDTGAKVE